MIIYTICSHDLTTSVQPYLQQTPFAYHVIVEGLSVLADLTAFLKRTFYNPPYMLESGVSKWSLQQKGTFCVCGLCLCTKMEITR